MSDPIDSTPSPPVGEGRDGGDPPQGTPPAWTVAVVVPVTFLTFFVMAVLWGLLGPVLIPALQYNERLITLTGFFPIELIGVLGPALIAMRLAKVDFRAAFPLKPVAPWRLLLVVLATTGLALVITYFQAWFTHLTGWTYPEEIAELIRARSPQDWLLLITAVALVPAFAEEMITRGYIQSSLVPRVGLWAGIGLTAAIFALLHMTPSGLPTYLVLGVWLSLIRHRTGSLWGNIAAHATNNTLAILQANFVPDSFWGPRAVFLVPLGVAIFGVFAWLSLRDPGREAPQG